MPTYEYHCSNCETNIEVEQSIKADPLKVCPECNEETLTRMISLSTFQLKGQGWYKDGYTKSSKND